ncbi:MAG: TRAP transporter small permease [Gammaproteobacteria bacterium]|nr:MAG: TRAP transporter small permease [Gammaproteobacteria bacterium]
MQTWVKSLHRAEDALLVILLTAMIVLACTQILLRNFFDSGIVWIDPLLRVMVLWIGLVGATVATRHNKHIRIDLLSRYFERNTHSLIQAIVGQVSAWTCLLIAWFGLGWIRLAYEDGLTSFAGIPAWMLEVIIPLSFALIGLRYLILSAGWARLYLRQRNAEDEASQ